MKAPAPRDVAELLSAIGHAGTVGRRPRILEGTIAAVPGLVPGTAMVSIHGADPVSVPVNPEYSPEPGHEVKIEAVQYDLWVRGRK